MALCQVLPRAHPLGEQIPHVVPECKDPLDSPRLGNIALLDSSGPNLAPEILAGACIAGSNTAFALIPQILLRTRYRFAASFSTPIADSIINGNIAAM